MVKNKVRNEWSRENVLTELLSQKRGGEKNAAVIKRHSDIGLFELRRPTRDDKYKEVFLRKKQRGEKEGSRASRC